MPDATKLNQRRIPDKMTDGGQDVAARHRIVGPPDKGFRCGILSECRQELLPPRASFGNIVQQTWLNRQSIVVGDRFPHVIVRKMLITDQYCAKRPQNITPGEQSRTKQGPGPARQKPLHKSGAMLCRIDRPIHKDDTIEREWGLWCSSKKILPQRDSIVVDDKKGPLDIRGLCDPCQNLVL